MQNYFSVERKTYLILSYLILSYLILALHCSTGGQLGLMLVSCRTGILSSTFPSL